MVVMMARSTSDGFPGLYPERLTRAGAHIANQLAGLGRPIIAPFDLYELIRHMYREQDRRVLYLRDAAPDASAYARLRTNLRKSGIIAPDHDYGGRLLRILAEPDLPADDIVCLADPTCYISHLSAMQRWGLTNRAPNALMLTRPDRALAAGMLSRIMEERMGPGETTPVPLRRITHPAVVRRREITVHDTKAAGQWIAARGTQTRISTIGQTFLDMLQKPEDCGGMTHVLETWEAHARTYLDEIIDAVDAAETGIVKSRAGYILDERLGVRDVRLAGWQALGQRGSSRKLDPSSPFASTFSEKWMISLNV